MSIFFLMHKNYPLLIFLILVFFCPIKLTGQNTIIKYIPALNTDIIRDKILDFDIYSYGAGYERVIGNHSSLELIVIRSRMVSHNGNLTKKLNGFGTELRYRYYFQTNQSWVTYAPFEFYLAPIVGYNQVQTKTLNDFHEIKNFNIGAIVGYQFIMELFEEGFSIDANIGIGANFPKIKGQLNNINTNSFTPRVGLTFGYSY